MMMMNGRDHKYPLGKEWGEMMIQIKKALAAIQESQIFSFEAEIEEIAQQPESSQQGSQLQKVTRKRQQ